MNLRTALTFVGGAALVAIMGSVSFAGEPLQNNRKNHMASGSTSQNIYRDRAGYGTRRYSNQKIIELKKINDRNPIGSMIGGSMNAIRNIR
ncbi:MAG: hypothetical protein ACR2PA_13360 [Hyphomicrobiaceae bacterium]